jgi:uncharacterized protein (TIGR03435 family)
MKQNLLRFCALFLSLACTLPSQAATTTAGQPAPPLTFTQLIGAPDGTKTDWPSLKGKVVVLEFWATWCAPCIAEIPHLNELAQSLASSNVQFISVDDEDPSVVKEFMAKKHMDGWVGLSKNIFDDFGVQERPTTIVIDSNGLVAARLTPELVQKDQLAALAEGKPVVFPVDANAANMAAAQKIAKAALAEMKNPTANAGPKPLFEISVRPGEPGGNMMMFSGNDTTTGTASYDFRNASLAMLLPWAADIPASRLVINGGAEKARYNLHVSALDLDFKQLSPALTLAVTSAAGVKLTHQSNEEDVWLLKATSQAATLLSPTASKHESMCFRNPQNGKLVMVGTSLDDLAPRLEEALGAPVLNDTSLPGEFDASFPLPKDTVDNARAALETNMGLTLVKARRTIDRVVVDPLPPQPKPDSPAAEAEKPAPGEMMKTIAVPRQNP